MNKTNLFLILCLTFHLYPKFETLPKSPIPYGMGGFLSDLPERSFDEYNIYGSFLYPFEVVELSRSNFRLYLPIFDTSIIVEGGSFGTDIYNESTISLGGKVEKDDYTITPTYNLLYQKVDDNRELDHSLSFISTYSDSTYSVQLGLENILSIEKEVSPTIYLTLLSVINREFTLAMEIEKCEDEDLIYKVGGVYKPFQNSGFLLGISPEQYSIYSGVVFSFRSIMVSYSTSYHSTLGLSHSSGIYYDF